MTAKNCGCLPRSPIGFASICDVAERQKTVVSPIRSECWYCDVLRTSTPPREFFKFQLEGSSPLHSAIFQGRHSWMFDHRIQHCSRESTIFQPFGVPRWAYPE